MKATQWLFSIRTKLAVITSGVIVLVGVFIYWYFPGELEKEALAAFKARGKSIATMTAYNLAPALLYDDRPAVCDMVLSAKQNPDLAYVMVVDTAGAVIATYDSVQAKELMFQSLRTDDHISADGETFQTFADIHTHEQIHGRLYVGLSLRGLNADMTTARRTIALVTFFVVAGGMLFVIIIATVLTEPLMRMVDAANRIRRGDWKQRAAVRSNDEVGVLASSFNSMLDTLEHAYEEARRNEANYHDLFDTNPHPIIVFDLLTQSIIDVNGAAIEVYEYNREEFLRLKMTDLVDTSPAKALDMLLAFEGTITRSVGWKHITQSGNIIDVELSSHPLPMGDQRYARIVVINDITLRILTEARLRESEERYRELFETASDLIFSVSPWGRFQFANNSLTTRIGFTSADIVVMDILDIVKPSEREAFARVLENVTRGKEHDFVQTTLVTRTGAEVIVEGSVNCMFSGDEPVSIQGIFRDVTARKAAEAEIMLEKTRFQQLFENAPIGIVLADRNEKIIHANRTFQTMFKYSLDELRGNTILNTIVPLSSAREALQLLDTTFAQGSVQTETVRVRKDGTLIHVGLYGVPILVNGESHGVFGMYVDIDQRKNAEARKAELVKELESTNKELNDFAYIVSHDLKAPLRAIGSLVDWLVTDYGEKLGAEGNEMLQMLLGRTKRMHELIDGILRYSRLSRAKEEHVAIELSQLLPEVLEMIDPPKHIAVSIEPDLPVVMGEPTRVGQVFQNLLTNAIKFMDKPEGEIKVECRRENGHWKFSVSDNGPGIEEKHFTKIFQIFQTLSSRDQFESTGIGLTIVKKIVEMHGGTIWVESKVGTGTTFFFTFPAN